MSIEEKAKAYDEALERAKDFKNGIVHYAINPGESVVDYVFPELRESEDERMIRKIKSFLSAYDAYYFRNDEWREIEVWLEKQKDAFENGRQLGIMQEQARKELEWPDEKQKEPEDKGEISDGYHTFNELYYYRMLYNAAFFNLLPKEWVHKSKKHHDGEECFGGGWFIVMANLPTGQVSNHYELKDWDLFQIPEKEIADEWDGHTPQEAAERLNKYLQEKQKEQKPELVQQPPITYTYNSNASRDARLKAALLALLNSDLLKIKEGGYFTKQDLIEWVERIPTDKPAWSEEDEKMVANLRSTLANISVRGLIKKETEQKYSAWLKSLRPQWKPTKEQMEALKDARMRMSLEGWGLCPILQSLINELEEL